MVQHGLLDQLEDREAIAKSIGKVPMSEREVLRELDGSDLSGAARDAFGDEVDEALLSVFHRVQVADGWDQAVLWLFSVTARNLDYKRVMPSWMLALFEDEKDLLMSAFWSNSVAFEPGSSDDDEDEEQATEASANEDSGDANAV